MEIRIWHYISISLRNDRPIHWAFHELFRKSAFEVLKTGLTAQVKAELFSTVPSLFAGCSQVVVGCHNRRDFNGSFGNLKVGFSMRH
jgi:hypothetical protein